MKQPLPLLLLALALTPLCADPVTLSMQDAVDLALGASLEVYGQKLALGSAQRDLDNSWNLLLPGISSGLSGKWSDSLFIEAPTSQGSAASKPFDATLGMGTRLTLTTGTLYDLEKRRTDFRLASLADKDSRARVERDAGKAYFLLVSLQLDLDNKAKAAALAGERYRLAALRFERGLGSELDVLRAQMSELNAGSAYKKATADYEKRQAAFRHQLGLAANVKLRLTTALEAPENIPDIAFTELVDGRVDMMKAVLAREVAANASARHGAVNRLPLITLDAGWNFSMTDFRNPRDSFSLSAGLSFNADAWIPKSRKDLELRALRDTEAQLALAYEQARKSALDEIGAIRLDIESAWNSLFVAGEQASLSERIYSRTTEAWERGSATILELEDAQLAVDLARQSLLAGRYQYLSLLIDLGYALNVDWRTLAKWMVSSKDRAQPGR